MKKKQNNNLSDLKAKKRAAISLDTEQANVDGHLKKMNLLALLVNFEKYWSPYSLSDGSLYRSEVKKEAKKVVDLFNELYGQNDSMTPSNILVKPDDLQPQRIFILSLKSWLNTDSLYPNINQQDMIVNRERSFFQQVLSDFENKLANELGLPVKMTFSATSYEELYHKNVLKWAAQLPNDVIPKIDDAYIENMSRYDTLVVVGDIRRSQDLMTYGSSPEIYRDKIIEFMNRTREILKNNCGLYDRFTGDGFIAYFNKYMCEQEGKDYYEMMIKACREILNFSNPFFED